MFKSIRENNKHSNTLTELISLNILDNTALYDFSNFTKKQTLEVCLPYFNNGSYQSATIKAKCYKNKTGSYRPWVSSNELTRKLPTSLIKKLSDCGINFENKTQLVYRILFVLFSFLKGKRVILQRYSDVHHKDKNPLNNRFSNLEIMSHREHARHHHYTFAEGDARTWGIPEIQEDSTKSFWEQSRFSFKIELPRISLTGRFKPLRAKIRDDLKIGDRVYSQLDVARQAGEIVGLIQLNRLLVLTVKFYSGKIDYFCHSQLSLISESS